MRTRRASLAVLSICASFLAAGCVFSVSVKSDEHPRWGRANKPAVKPAKEKPPAIDPTIETEVFRRINEIRTKHKLSALKANPKLDEVARAYSKRMATENFFNHTSPTGDNTSDRARAAGFNYRALGENLFMSENMPHPAASAAEGWMQSKGHWENILTPDFVETGVGVWHKGGKYYITQIFFTALK